MEKEKSKKITAVGLTAALIAIVICCVGCQSGNAAPDPTETTGATAATTEATGATTVEPTDHTHEYVEEVVEAGCVERGYTTYTCSCGDEYTDNFTDAVGHSWGSWVVTKEATESATGVEERVCGGCNATETREVPKVIPNHTHKYTSKETKKATCTADGVITYTCSCGESYTESVAKTGHKYVDTVVKPTCTRDGYTTSKCSVCGNTKTTAGGKATGHSYKSVVTAPTYTAGGYTTYTCNTCGYSYKGNYTDKLEPKPTEPAPTEHKHSYSAKVTTAPTCTKDGVKTFSCSCGKDTYTEVIPATGHSYSVTSQKAATCSEAGYKTYTCSSCKDSYTETVTAPHNWVHHHTDEVGHEEVYYVCHCGGWSFNAANGNPGPSFVAHAKASEDPASHSYYTTAKWVIDTPASDYYKCSVCGTRNEN